MILKTKDLKFGSKARESFLKGIDLLADAVQSTLGPGGRNVAIDRENGDPHITKDGVTVAKSISKLDDPYENMGAQLVRSVAAKTGDVAGDGTTTATVLARALVKAGLELPDNLNVTQVKEGMYLALDLIEKYIRKHAKPLKTSKDIKNVARISANGDESIAKIIADAFTHVGFDGIISIESGTHESHQLTVTNGFRYKEGFSDMTFFINSPRHMKVELDNPYILVSTMEIKHILQLQHLLKPISEQGRQLLIVAPNFATSVIRILQANVLNGAIMLGITKLPPGFNEDHQYLAQDIALVTGAKVIGPEAGLDVKDAKLEDLGQANHVTITRNHTTIIEGYGNKENITKRIEQLKDARSKLTEPRLRDQLARRIANILGKVAVISVGGATNAEIGESKDRMDDALAAVLSAHKGGTVVGGGLALLRAGYGFLEHSKHPLGLSNDVKFGLLLVKDAVSAPARQIIINIGNEFLKDAQLDNPDNEFDVGFNGRTKKYENLRKAGVIDPVEVVLAALRNAISVASLILTTEVAIIDKVEPIDMVAIRQ